MIEFLQYLNNWFLQVDGARDRDQALNAFIYMYCKTGRVYILLFLEALRWY